MCLKIRIVLLICVVLSITSCQLIIPKRPLGYVYNGGSNDAPIHLDVHIDPLCHDCKIAFPTVLEVARYYGASPLKLTSHVFPLPYFRQSYLTAIAARVIRNINSVDIVYRWFDKIYIEKLPFLYTSVTNNLTADDVTRLLADFVVELGVNKSDFLIAMASKEPERNTRAAWKYSCTRGVANTPTYFLNDVPLTAETKWTLEDWREVIDPLLGRKKKPKECCCSGTNTGKSVANKKKCKNAGKRCRCGCCKNKERKQKTKTTTHSLRTIKGRLFLLK